jgi:hypothetical protein
MIRKLALAAAAGALALGGLAAVGPTASAAPPTINAATSASVNCSFTAKAKIAPALKSNWVQSQHQLPGETNALVRAIPDTKFSTDGPGNVSSKAKSTACTGTITQGAVTATVTSVKIDLVQFTAAVDAPPLQVDNTCDALLAGTQPGDTAATYRSTVKIKASGAKVTDTVITGSTISPATPDLGFKIEGGTITGSLAGGNSKALAFIDSATLAAFGAAPASSTTPTPSSNKCQATLKIKGGAHPSASLKPPKGLKKIAVGNNLANPSQPSNICFRKGSTCP